MSDYDRLTKFNLDEFSRCKNREGYFIIISAPKPAPRIRQSKPQEMPRTFVRQSPRRYALIPGKTPHTESSLWRIELNARRIGESIKRGQVSGVIQRPARKPVSFFFLTSRARRLAGSLIIQSDAARGTTLHNFCFGSFFPFGGDRWII